jgi:hypothetical protein
VRGINVTLLNLEEAMNEHYRQIKGSKPAPDETEKELMLGAFGGIYFHCKQAEHKAYECPKKGGTGGKYKGKQGKFQKKCDNCGKPGHKADDCWQQAKNEGKRPKWCKSSGEVGATAQEKGKTGSLEFLLCGITKDFSFPKNQDFLIDPNIWIANLAATVHTTLHKQGFHTLTTATEANSITMGYGIAEKASLVGKITGTMCNKNGIKFGTATLTDVVHLPTGRFNLFS